MPPAHFADRLLRRELGDDRYSRYSSVAGLYGDRKWIHDLDIVNELRGHSGCVNALNWSRSGELLASGSDDTTVLLHKYAPDAKIQFEELGAIFTGHSANIFSIKFMPHSNDRTIVTAAGDNQVRIFDVEYSGRTKPAVMPSSSRNRGPLGFGSWNMIAGDDDSNVKVFRCHTDRVKRIVTESSPFFFLTCSEDGDVRQWDIRLPSSAYPAPRHGSSFVSSYRPENIPAPLISYKRYGLDLNTISCSPSQPHYIAVGGTHLHCFLHDRRYLGRDILSETGSPGPSGGIQSTRDEEMVSQATQCVMKFAPDGQPRMKAKDNGHITACKISDAYPNELIVSWSGDSIYSFDIIRGSALQHEQHGSVSGTSSNRVRESKHRKRKRPQTPSHDSYDDLEQATARLRTESVHSDAEEGLALRVQYGNGQHEDIPIEAGNDVDTEKNNRAREIAAQLVKIRNGMFMLERQTSTSTVDLALHENAFSSILRSVAHIIPVVDDAINSWQHHDEPSAWRNTRREHQAACRRFLQAAGLLSRVLGGKLPTIGEPGEEERNASRMQRYFTTVGPASAERDATLLQNEQVDIHPRAQFCYDFLKAICLWLDSGIGALLQGFSSSAGRGKRYPIKPNASIAAVDTVLVPYLERLASDKAIMNVDISRFEINEHRVVFATEKAAVAAFAEALKIPFADLFRDVTEGSARAGDGQSQDRRTALKYWAFTVGRGVLMNAVKLELELPFLDFEFAKKAFGGTGRASAEVRDAERDFWSRHEDIHTPASPNDDNDDSDAGSYEEYDEDTSDEDDDPDNDLPPLMWARGLERNKIRARAHLDVNCQAQTRKYSGHMNTKTVKDVNFFGRDDEYIVSGSDCGHLFIWDKKTCRIVNILEGDSEVVNVAQGHPYEPMLAVSGIDNTIKVFSPDAVARQNAREGTWISRPNATPWRPRRHVADDRFAAREDAPGPTSDGEEDEDAEDREDRIGTNGLRSRKKLHLEYQITAANAHAAQHTRDDLLISRALFAEIAARIQSGESLEEGVVVQDNCAMQ